MVTVDDLVISLTIKETGRLGRLQKQLDAIVGKKGQRLGFGLGSLGNIPADIAFIKRRIMYLRPTFMPTKEQPLKLRAEAGRLLKDIEDFPKQLVEKLLKVRPQDYKTYLKEFEVDTDEELRKAMEQSLDQVKELLGDIYEGVSLLPPHKQEETIATLNSLVEQALQSREIGMRFWREIGKLMPEKLWQARIVDLFRKITGKVVVPEKKLFKVKPTALELPEIQKELGLGEMPEEVTRFLDALEEGKTDLRGLLSDVKNFYVYKKIQDITGAQTAGSVDLATTLKSLIESGATEKIEEVINAVKEMTFKKLTTEDIKAMGIQLVSPETKERLDEIYQEVTGLKQTATMGAKRIDVEVEDLSKLTKLLELEIEDVQNVGIELKKIITEEDIQQLQEYMKYYGEEGVILIGQQVSKAVLELAKALDLEKYIKTIPNLRELEEQYGMLRPLISPETEEFKEELRNLTNEIDKNRDLIKKWLENPESIPKEKMEQILDYLQGFAHRLGVNPNQIDLPNEFEKLLKKEDLRKDVELPEMKGSLEFPKEFEELPTKEEINRDLQNIIEMIEENANFPNILETLEFTKNEMITLLDLIENLESSNEETVRNAIEELAHRLGINPNMIDLPDFIRNIGRSILDLAQTWGSQDVSQLDRTAISRLFSIVAGEIVKKREFTDLDLIAHSLQKIQGFIEERPSMRTKTEEMPYLRARLDGIIKTINTFHSDMKDMLGKKSYEPERKNAPKGF